MTLQIAGVFRAWLMACLTFRLDKYWFCRLQLMLMTLLLYS